jgi:hypothetical protein
MLGGKQATYISHAGLPKSLSTWLFGGPAIIGLCERGFTLPMAEPRSATTSIRAFPVTAENCETPKQSPSEQQKDPVVRNRFPGLQSIVQSLP